MPQSLHRSYVDMLLLFVEVFGVHDWIVFLDFLHIMRVSTQVRHQEPYDEYYERFFEKNWLKNQEKRFEQWYS